MENLTDTFYLSMVLIGVGSFLFGILPIAFSFGGTRSYPFSLSLILCLGGGVLLATSLVHMLTEVQEKLKLHSQLYFCAGFLALYAIDEISHYCLASKDRQMHSVAHVSQSHESKNRYGATHPSFHSTENSPLLRTEHQKDFQTFSGHFENRPSQQFLRCGCISEFAYLPLKLQGLLEWRQKVAEDPNDLRALSQQQWPRSYRFS